jgi:hypothetical protein
MTDKVPINDIVAAYRRVRTAISDAEAAHKARMEEMRNQLDLLSAELLNFCNEQNLDSVRTPEGTISRRVQTRYWTTDWDSMYRFINENEAPFLLERRINNVNLKQFMEENPDTFPAGLQVDNKYVIYVRKPNEK